MMHRPRDQVALGAVDLDGQMSDGGGLLEGLAPPLQPEHGLVAAA